MNSELHWKPIVSTNSHLKTTSTSDFLPPSFEEISIGDLVKLKVFVNKNNFVLNVLDEPNLTRVERVEKIPIHLKSGIEYEGIVLEKFIFFNEIKNHNEEILKIMLGFDEEQYFVHINSCSCWYSGLIIYKFSGLS